MANGVTVYCASSSRIHPAYMELARETGRLIARAGYDVVTGGGRGGLMAAVIEGATEAGGHTIGVLPRFMMEREWNHPALSETIVTESMHERKHTLASLSVGAIALPGGVGTLDELFEIITWRQLKLFGGNVVICNARGFYDRLLDHLAFTAHEGFMRAEAPKRLWSVATTAAEAVEMATADPSDPGILYHL